MRLYQLLLRCYPASFRAEYGREMAAIFRRRHRDASTWVERAALWTEVLRDTAMNAARVHADIFAQDVRYTWRSLGHSPGFTFTVIIVAALGIGATTATFSLADHVMFRPLPFREPHRLVMLWQDQSARGYPMLELSPPNFRDWKTAAKSFEMMGAYTGQSATLIGAGEPQRLQGVAISYDVLTSLGVRPALGRAFAPADEDLSAPATVVLSHATWMNIFGGDPAAIERTVLLNDEPHRIVGVMPSAFQFPARNTQFWTVLRFTPDALTERSNYSLNGIARLAPGVTIDQARAELNVIAANLERAYPKDNENTRATVRLLQDQVPNRSRGLLMALVGAAVCVLLIACTNLANLLLARAISRQKELAVRTAIGAGADRLMRQMMTESGWLALCGGIGGLLIAYTAAPLLARLVPTTLPISEAPPLDARVLILAAIVTLGTGLGFGIFPALRIRRGVDIAALRDGARVGSSAGTRRVRATLVILQIAASVLLLVGSGLLLRALWRVQSTDPGFRTESVLTLRTWLPIPKYAPVARREAFYRDVLSGVRAVPGVAAAGYISYLPMTMRGGIFPVAIEGENNPATDPVASLRYVTPGLFDALGMRLLRGRGIADTDTRTAPFVAVVSESFAERHWPGRDPIGRRFEFAFAPRTIVGVVNNVSVRGLERISEPQVYLSSAQVEDGWLTFHTPKDLAVKSSVPTAQLMPAIREIVARVDPQQAISDVQTLDDIVAADSAPRRTQARVLIAFAALAFALAALGIHSLLSFLVASQTREIGVRVALGAQSSDVMRLVLGRTAVLTVAGIVAGVVLAYLVGRTMESILFGVNPGDAPTFAAAIGLTVVMALAGSIIPMVRAMRVDPKIAMSVE